MSELLALAGLVVVMLGALAAIVRAVIWLWQTLSKLARLADGLLGEPPGPGAPNGRPGVLDRLTAIDEAMRVLASAQAAQDERLRYVETQMRPNGGTSLRDTVDRIAASSEATA